MKKNNTKTVEIPDDGNLGILAYGDIALKAWRKKRGEITKTQSKTKTKSKSKKDAKK